MTASPQTEAMLTMRRARRSRREVTVRIVVPLVVIGLFVVIACAATLYTIWRDRQLRRAEAGKRSRSGGSCGSGCGRCGAGSSRSGW